MAPLYHSGTAGETSGGLKCIPCEATKLICQAPQSLETDPPSEAPASVSFVNVSLPSAEGMREEEGVQERTATEDVRKRAVPEELSEEEVVNTIPLSAGSCTCTIPIREPLEVGENEDCSQAVIPEMAGTCSCGGLDGGRHREESRNDFEREKEKMSSSNKETSGTSLVALSSPLIHTSALIPPSNPSPELCVPLSQARVRPKDPSIISDKTPVKQEELYGLASTDSTSAESSAAHAMTLVSALMTSSSAGDLYLDKPSGASRLEKSSCRDSRESKLEESELGCSPESLHSQVAEPSLTSGT